MTTSALLILAGLTLLVIGGELLLRGAVGLATLLKLTPAVIGLTIVAAGTSVPELAVSAVAAMENKTDITVGNVVGSNIFNIAAILGLVASYKQLKIIGNTLKLEYPVLLIVTLLFVVLSQDQLISRLEAFLFIGIYIIFTVFVVSVVKKELNTKEKSEFTEEVEDLEGTGSSQPGFAKSLVYTAIGVVLLGFGADLTVKGASAIGVLFGLSERIIGLTIVGAGTGLPELVTSVVSAYRGRADVAIANVIGSNMFNILGIIGITSALSPLRVSQGIILSDNWWMLAITALLFPIMRSGYNIRRIEGFILLLVYITYISLLILKPS